MHDLIGLHSAKKIYHQLSNQSYHPHAFLFYGARGSGKTTVALEFSKFFLGKEVVFPITQIDLLWIQPSQNSSLIRLANIVGQDKSLEQPSLKDFLLTLPLTHNFKVAVIEDVHCLTLEAANALLKILEEPPYFAKFILTTSSLYKVLPTIASRCLNISCELPSLKELEEKWPTKTLAETIFSNNIPGRKNHIQNHLDLYQNLFEIIKESSYIFKLKTAENLRAWCNQYSKQQQISLRQALSECLECLALWFLYYNQYQKVQKICQLHKTLSFNYNLNYLIDALVIDLIQ